MTRDPRAPSPGGPQPERHPFDIEPQSAVAAKSVVTSARHRANREELITGDDVVGDYLPDQRAGGVEIEDRCERRGVWQ